MDLQVIFDCIVPDNIKNIPLIKVCTNIFIEQINRNSQIAINIGKLFDLENDTQIKIDGDNITQIIDSDAVKNSKDILRLGLFYTYINSIYTLILRLQRDRKIPERFFNSEYLGGLREYQKNCGSKRAIHYMYAFAKYLETGTIVHDLELTEGSILNLRYDGSLNKDIFIDFNKPLAHPCGWLCEYERFEPYVPIPVPKDLNFLDAPLDDSIIDLMENYLVIDNYHRDIYDENYNVVETQTFYRYTNGVTDKCLYFPRIDWVKADNTEYPPIEYPEHDDWVIAHDLSSQKLLGVRLEERYYSEGDSWYPVVIDNGVENKNIYDYEYGEYHTTNTTRRNRARWGYEDYVYTQIHDAEFVNENGFITCQVDFNSEISEDYQGTNDDSESFIDYSSSIIYTGENESWRKIEFYLRFCNTENLDLFTEKVYEYCKTKDDELFGKYDDDFYIWQTTASLSELLEQLKTTYFPDSLISKYDEKISPNNNLCFLFDYTYQNNNTIVIPEVELRDLYFYDKSTEQWYFYILEVNTNNETINIFDCTQYFYSGEWFKVELIKTDDCVLRIGNQEHNVTWNYSDYRGDTNHYVRVETHCMGNYGTEHAIYSQCANLKQYVPNSDSGYDFGYPWINVECKFWYDKVILTADVYNDDPLGYSLLWSTGETTRSIMVDYEEYPRYEVTATNRAGSGTSTVDYFSYCGYDVYSLDFCLKDDLETPPIYNLEFDFKATVDDLKPLIYLQGYWNEKVLSLGACYYSYNDYLYLENTDENKVPYDNKYLNNWYHYKVHVDNTNLTVSININDNEVATINLNEELIPYVVEFSCGLNGFFGCTSDYYIDNLKITYKEEEWQH